MNIDTMPAGPELDALVAEKVMGWRWTENEIQFILWDTLGRVRAAKWKPDLKLSTWLCDSMELYHFSTDIAAAWQVVEKMRAMGWEPRIDCYEKGTNVITYDPHYNELSQASDDSPALAICRAALKAVGA